MKPLDVDAIVRALLSRGVDFVIIGGVAAVLHGSPRATFDLDICFATDHENLTALGEVLSELGARLRDVTDEVAFVPDAATLRRVDLLTLETQHGGLDVIARPAGTASYEALRGAAERYDLGGIRVLVASPLDLIAMKRASGRPKDLADIAELEAIVRLRREIDAR